MKQPERETDTHIYFWDSMFSNWYPIQFDYKGHTFQNASVQITTLQSGIRTPD